MAPSQRLRSSFSLACLLGLSLTSLEAGTFQWNVSTPPANGNWATGASWVGNAAPTGSNVTDILIFGGDVGTAAAPTNYTAINDVGAIPFLLNTLTLQATDAAGLATDPAHIITGNQVRPDGTAPQIQQSGTGPVTFDVSFFLPKNLLLTGDGSGVVTFNRGFSGFADITKSGTSTFRFGTFPILPATKAPSENSWIGTLALNDGTFRFNNNAESGRTALRANPLSFPAALPVSGLTPLITCSSELRTGTLSGIVGQVESAVVGTNSTTDDLVITTLTNGDFGGTVRLGPPTGTGNDTGRLVVRGPGVQTFSGTMLIEKDVNIGGNLTLSGTASLGNQLKGSVTLGGGSLRLDNTAGNVPSTLDIISNRLRDASGSSTSIDVVGGGSLSLIGATNGSTEVLGRLQLSSLTGTSPNQKTKARSGHLNLSVTHRAGASAATVLNFATLNRDGTTLQPLNTVQFSAVDGAGATLNPGSAGNNPRLLFSTAPSLTNSLITNNSGTGSVGWATAKMTTGLAFATHDPVNGIAPIAGTAWANNAATNALLATSQTITTGTTFNLNSLRILPGSAGLSLAVATGGVLNTTGILLAGNTDYTISGAGTAALTGIGTPRFLHVENATLALGLALGNSAPLVKAGGGTLVLTNTTNNSNQQILAINQGIVRAAAGTTLPAGEIRFRGGVLELSSGGTFNRPLLDGSGISGPGTVHWSTVELAGSPVAVPTSVDADRGSGGFAALGSNVIVDLDAVGADTILWEQKGFVQSGYALVFGSRSATAKVTLLDNLSLTSSESNINYNAREIRVDDNVGSSADRAVLAGVVSGSIYNDLLKTGAGVLELGGNNTFQGMAYVQAGTLIFSGTNISAIGIEVLSGATLAGNGTVTTLLLDSGGKIAPGDGTTATLTGTSLDWKAGGTCRFDLGAANASDRLVLGSGALTKNGSGTFTFDFGSTGSTNQTYTLATFGSTNFVAGDFTAINLPGGVAGQFSVTANSLVYSTVPPTAIDTWRVTYFGAGANNSGNAADLADSDQDGISNLLEYPLNGNPTASTRSILPMVGGTPASTVVTFNRLTTATDVTLYLECANALTPTPTVWTAIATRPNGGSWSSISNVLVNENGGGAVTVTDNRAANTHFYRLKVQRP